MKFMSNNNGEILITENGEELFSIKPWLLPNEGERIYLQAKNCCDNIIEFSNTENNCRLSLKLISKENLNAFTVNVDYALLNDDEFDKNHLSLGSSAGIDFKPLFKFENATTNVMGDYWCSTKIVKDIEEFSSNIQALLFKKTGDYLYFVTTCDDEVKTRISKNNADCFSLIANVGYPKNHLSFLSVVIGNGKDPFVLPEQTVSYGMELMNKSGKMRKDRRYPEVLEYLGWCSWDAFHMDVSHDNLMSKLQEFKDKDIPVSWVMIDDMWAYCPNNSLKSMHSRELYSFEADPVRFRKGLKYTVSEIKEKYGVKVGMWHPTTGYWHGIDPQGSIAAKLSDSLVTANDGRLVPSYRMYDMFRFFYEFHSFLALCGTDFVKVDNQSSISWTYRGMAPIGVVAKNLHNAIEASVGVCFDGDIINCMGMGNEAFWNRPNSAVNRISNDFLPENRKWFIQHLLQCSFNSYFQGCVYTGDWDMWWSDDEQAVKNSVLRAMSGGPVYVSDTLNRSKKEIIMPIVYSDGKIIRLKDPARPTKDCLSDNFENNGKVFKIFNKIDDVGILAAFNLDSEEKTVSGEAALQDIYGLDKREYIVFDYFAKSVVGNGNEPIKISLQNYDDFRLFYYLPISNSNIVPIGLIDKYMAPATFKKVDGYKYILYEGGKFAVYSLTDILIKYNNVELEPFEVNNNIYTFDIPCDNKNFLIEILH